MDAKTRFEENTSLVFLVLRRYFPLQAFDQDLQQIGMLGLWKACLTFDESKGYQFSTYASRCIHNQILMHFRSEKKVKNLPTINLDDYVDEDRNEDSFYILKDKDNKYSYLDIVDSLNHVISNYNSKYRKVVELHLRGMDQVDIGKEVGFSQSYVSRIVSKFRKDMEEELYENSSR